MQTMAENICIENQLDSTVGAFSESGKIQVLSSKIDSVESISGTISVDYSSLSKVRTVSGAINIERNSLIDTLITVSGRVRLYASEVESLILNHGCIIGENNIIHTLSATVLELFDLQNTSIDNIKIESTPPTELISYSKYDNTTVTRVCQSSITIPSTVHVKAVHFPDGADGKVYSSAEVKVINGTWIKS